MLKLVGRYLLAFYLLMSSSIFNKTSKNTIHAHIIKKSKQDIKNTKLTKNI